MKALFVAFSLCACGGSVPVQIPDDATLEFTVRQQQNRPALDCLGKIYMSTRTAEFSCTDARQPSAAGVVIRVTVEYIQRTDEAWLHMLAIGDERSHYPTYNAIVIALGLKPNQAGDGWEGDAVYYPRDAVFGYADLLVTARSL
jgi:hypothetical protein